MLVVDITYTAELSEIEKVLADHRNFLQTYYDNNTFLASGPKNPRTGGVILAQTDKSTMENIIAQDPYNLAGVAEYTITEFEPVKCRDDLAGILAEMA